MKRIFHTVHDLSILFMTDCGKMENELAHRLVKARSGHGWSQADLSEVSGVAAAQISRYESGRAKPRPEVVAKLAKSLAVGFEWLAYGKGSVDVGATVPRYPSQQTQLLSVELDPELYKGLSELAEKKGITLEMTFKQIVRVITDQMAGDPEALKKALREFRESKPKP